MGGRWKVVTPRLALYPWNDAQSCSSNGRSSVVEHLRPASPNSPEAFGSLQMAKSSDKAQQYTVDYLVLSSTRTLGRGQAMGQGGPRFESFPTSDTQRHLPCAEGILEEGVSRQRDTRQSHKVHGQQLPMVDVIRRLGGCFKLNPGTCMGMLSSLHLRLRWGLCRSGFQTGYWEGSSPWVVATWVSLTYMHDLRRE